MDYTPEGIHHYQTELGVSYLHLIDKKLKKINRNVKILTLLGITLVILKNKDTIKQLKNVKGE